jgi:hypothetical protein
MGMLMHHTWLAQQKAKDEQKMPVKEASEPVKAEPVEEAKEPVKRVARNAGRKRTGK